MDVIFEWIDLVKDVDGLYLINFGWFVFNVNGLIYILLLCMLCGVIELLLCNDYDF